MLLTKNFAVNKVIICATNINVINCHFQIWTVPPPQGMSSLKANPKSYLSGKTFLELQLQENFKH